MENLKFNIYAHAGNDFTLIARSEDFQTAYNRARILHGLVIITECDSEYGDTRVVYSNYHM